MHFRGLHKRLLATEEVGVIVALLSICVALSLTTKTFLTSGNLIDVAQSASSYGIMAVGMVMLLAMGDIDLSVGSIYSIVMVVVAIALRADWPMPLAVLAGLVAGGVCGLINGVLSVALRIPTIIVTLGTMKIFNGLGLVISGAKPISQFPKDNWLFTVAGGDVLGIPFSVHAMLGVCLAGYLLLNHSAFGWRIQAIGSNRQAARFSGIAISRYRIAAMTLMGLICSVAGIVTLAYYKTADPAVGPGEELSVIAAAIVGGTALKGGSGSVPGAILGALVIAVINDGLAQWGLTSLWSGAVTGTVIIVAVALGNLAKRR